MPSMSYCAFENTSMDIKQLIGLLEEHEGSLESFIESRSSPEEARSVRLVIELCQELCDIAEDMDW